MRRTVSNWRLPNEFGLSERTLDCLQLAVMEALWRDGGQKMIQIFLNPFDCIRVGLSLRRSEPALQAGYQLVRFSAPDAGALEEVIRYLFEREGYCMLFYQTWEHELSAYRDKYNLTHWSFITDVGDTELMIADSAGHPDYFARGTTAIVPWRDFRAAFERTRNYGAGYVRQEAGCGEPWPELLDHLLQASVHNMREWGGLQQMQEFAEKLEGTSVSELVLQLESLEFELNYYRKLRDLWKTAVFKQVIPRDRTHAGWVQALMDSCECWSLVMGVLMKWKRQPERDYKDKLVHYMWEVYDREQTMFTAMAETVGRRKR
ncbi:hypothetical protein [Paenibacillus tarimensis]|uniref:hypothetical protein n=1 Tax=Paenibacillus tarimensis TaxID=416012 RepID=UPI001F379BA7|nr:hypothetical protein [Paenibacillus tarimensis]MCF2945188.1 hypothetical protein [Paenibacillus tarimensis]